MKIYLDFNDWWIGYYRGPNNHYFCPFFTVVIRWPRRRKLSVDIDPGQFFGTDVVTSDAVESGKIVFINQHGIDSNPSGILVDEILEKCKSIREMKADTVVFPMYGRTLMPKSGHNFSQQIPKSYGDGRFQPKPDPFPNDL